MSTASWFDDIPVIGRLSPIEAAIKLHESGEDELAAALECAPEVYEPQIMGSKGPWRAAQQLFAPRPWAHTAHTFGYLAPADPGRKLLPIQHAGNIAADSTLKDSRITIRLNQLRVADYPGRGLHRILFDFYAQNQAPDNVEHLHFNATYRVQEGEQAAVVGLPLFVGLQVGRDGVAFKCFTVNVQNDTDEAFLNILESDEFRSGLELVTTVQPALAPLSKIALDMTRAIATRSRNVAVQEFYLGLDFGRIPLGARLAEGAYLAVQIPETLQAIWDWSEWAYDPANGRIVNRKEPANLIPYNYLVLSVSRYEGE